MSCIENTQTAAKSACVAAGTISLIFIFIISLTHFSPFHFTHSFVKISFQLDMKKWGFFCLFYHVKKAKVYQPTFRYKSNKRRKHPLCCCQWSFLHWGCSFQRSSPEANDFFFCFVFSFFPLYLYFSKCLGFTLQNQSTATHS